VVFSFYASGSTLFPKGLEQSWGLRPIAAISVLTQYHANVLHLFCRRCSTVNNESLPHPARMLARLWWAGPLLISYLSLLVPRVDSANPVEYWGRYTVSKCPIKCLYLLTIVCACAAAAGFESTSISLWPSNVTCLPVQITIRFIPNMTIDNRDYVVIMLPGFTSGACNGTWAATSCEDTGEHSPLLLCPASQV
jgi:hypothetical protein